MSAASPSQATPLLARPLPSRLLSAAAVVGAGSVLGLASWLDPSSAGHSTHTQLGLDPCTILVLTGWPCPMCGMTTTFALMGNLRPVAALLNQPFGVLLYLGTLATFWVGLLELVRPRGRWYQLLQRLAPHEGRLATIFLAAMFLGWIYKILLMQGFLPLQP